MSKSELSDLSRINLTDEKDQIINKIKKAKTDTLPLPSTIDELNNRPEAKNLIGIYSSLTGLNSENSLKKFSGQNFSVFKENLSEIFSVVIEDLAAMVISITDSNSEIVYTPGRDYDVERFHGDPSRMNEILGYKCSNDIMTGLEKCAKLHRKRVLLSEEANV